MTKLVLATTNRGKVAELAVMLKDVAVQVVSIADLLPDWDVVEDGITFEENAAKKAVACAKATGCWALADDSGLEVDSLGGAPGIHSARYAGEAPRSDEANNRKLLTELERLDPGTTRAARFRAVLVLASPSGEPVAKTEGTCEGRIAFSPRGENGFGYDPLFESKEAGWRTTAELPPAEKNRLSHRGRAFAAMKPHLMFG